MALVSVGCLRQHRVHHSGVEFATAVDSNVDICEYSADEQTRPVWTVNCMTCFEGELY